MTGEGRFIQGAFDRGGKKRGHLIGGNWPGVGAFDRIHRQHIRGGASFSGELRRCTSHKCVARFVSGNRVSCRVNEAFYFG